MPTRGPISIEDVRAAQERLRSHLPPSPLRTYAVLDDAVGGGVRVVVKHENFQPTGSFKVRNGLAALTALPEEARRRGVVAATRGNHGLGLAHAGAKLGIAVTVCVPLGNNPEKNAAIRGLGAALVEEGRDYDESVQVADRLVRDRGLTLVHSTNDRSVIAGAGTLAVELLEEDQELDALVIAVGGGSQAVGALVVAQALRPGLPVFAVQAEGAPTVYESWRAGGPRPGSTVNTFADGLATRSVYALTLEPLLAGLADFITVSDREIAAAIRLALRTTHTLVEGAGAAGLAGLLRLRDRLAGLRVGIVFSGANIDERTLRRVLAGEI